MKVEFTTNHMHYNYTYMLSAFSSSPRNVHMLVSR